MEFSTGLSFPESYSVSKRCKILMIILTIHQDMMEFFVLVETYLNSEFLCWTLARVSVKCRDVVSILLHAVIELLDSRLLSIAKTPMKVPSV